MIHTLPHTSGAKILHPHDRWVVLVDLVTARAVLGLNDRDLAVLRGLISCLPKGDLAKTFVFASNQTLSTRCDGMHERTLRRHLARLIAAGLITRHDSPNRKRYVRRTHLGQAAHAFGFDLAPLYGRSAEINQAANTAWMAADTVAVLREELSLLRQSLAMHDIALADDIRKLLRRNAEADELRATISSAKHRLGHDSSCQPMPHDTPILTANDSHSVRHIQISYKDIKDSEDCDKQNKMKKGAEKSNQTAHTTQPQLSSILAACPDSCAFAYQPITNWPDLIRFAEILAPMVQIDRQVMTHARQSMGAVAAAIAVMCIVQLGEKIRSAGAYLRVLTKRAAVGGFSISAMVQALLAAQTKIGAGG